MGKLSRYFLFEFRNFRLNTNDSHQSAICKEKQSEHKQQQNQTAIEDSQVIVESEQINAKSAVNFEAWVGGIAGNVNSSVFILDGRFEGVFHW